MHIGLKIKELIVEKSFLTFQSFAQKIGYSEQGLHKILKKEDLSTEIIKKVCEELSISVSEFFAEKQVKSYKETLALSVIHDEKAIYGEVNYKEKYYEVLEKLNTANERLLGFTDLKKDVIEKKK